MSLPPELRSTLKNYIDADPVLSAFPLSSDGSFAIAELLNLEAAPVFYIWRTKGEVSIGEILGNGFDYTRIDNLTIGRARIWDEIKLAIQVGEFNPTSTNHRAGISAAYNQAADADMRLSLFTHLQRLATVAEKLFSTGAGVTTTNAGIGPATSAWHGTITHEDVTLSRLLG